MPIENKENGSITTMDFRRADFAQRPAWKQPLRQSPGKKWGPEELVNFQGSYSPRSRTTCQAKVV